MNFFVKSLLKKQLKGVPESEIERIILLVEKNPVLFQQIAAEIQAKMKTGIAQQDAAMAVMKEHEAELKEALK